MNDNIQNQSTLALDYSIVYSHIASTKALEDELARKLGLTLRMDTATPTTQCERVYARVPQMRMLDNNDSVCRQTVIPVYTMKQDNRVQLALVITEQTTY